MRIGKTLRVAAMTLALAMAVTPALVDYADAGRGGGRGGGGHGMRGGGGGHAMRGVGGGGRHYSGGGSRRYSGYSGSGSRRYSGKHYSGNHYNYRRGHGYYRHGHGYGYWRGGVWIATGIVGYGAGSYCSRLYYYNYNRWLYECQ